MMRRRCLRLSLSLLLMRHAAPLTPSPPSSTKVPLGTLSVAPVALGSLNLDLEDGEQIANLLRSLPPSTLIDTAEVYGKGKAERLLGEHVRKCRVEERVFFATKFAPQMQRTSADSIVDACRRSAAELQVDRIDLYQVHYADDLLPLVALGFMKEKDDVYWDGLAECYHQGLAANVGVCNYGPTMIRRAHEALKKRGVPLVSNQIGFNLLRYGVTRDVKEVCDELGITVLAYSPLGKGVLSGKYDPDDNSKLPPQGTGRYYRYKRCLKASTELRAAIDGIATARGMAWPQVMYNWGMSKGVIPIAGARDESQSFDMHGASGWSLTDDEVEQLDAVAGENISPTKEFVLT